jgi:hypothetical protein
MLDSTIWRERANEFRALSTLTLSPVARTGWLKLAAICDELAADLEGVPEASSRAAATARLH